MSTMHPHQTLINEVNREINTRKRVYPNWVHLGRIDIDTARQRIEILQSVLRFLVENDPRLDGERQTTLFDEQPHEHRDPTA